MSFSNDQLTFLVAAYAAVVSTVLGVWEFIKEKRKVVIFLVENNGQQYSITITNIGHRPITLMNLHMNIPSLGLKPLNSLLWFKDGEDEVKSPLPVTLTDGEHVTIKISLKVSKYIKEEKEKKGFAIVINDAESKTYKKYKNLSYDSKSGNLLVKK